MLPNFLLTIPLFSAFEIWKQKNRRSPSILPSTLLNFLTESVSTLTKSHTRLRLLGRWNCTPEMRR